MNNLKQIEEVLREEGVFVSTTSGYSMYPMLRDRRDTIAIRTYEGRLKKYDVPLYKSGNKYVLHRIIRVKPDSYVIRGDNCDKKEFGITDEQILGVLTEFYRDDKKIDMNGWKYKMYVRVHCKMFVVWWLWRRMKYVIAGFGRLFKKGK